MTFLSDEDAEVLRRFLAAIQGAQEEFVLVGGQAARLFRMHPLAVELAWPPVATRDIDVASLDRGHRAQVDIASALAREGFNPRYEGDDRPPMTHYVWGNSELEFIVPSVPRRGSPAAFVDVLGATAQKVDDLEPVLVSPTELVVDGVGIVRVANPAAFLIQKVLTVTNRRSLSKKGKDALYVFDVLRLFTFGGRLRNEIIAQSRGVLATLTKKQKKRLSENEAKLGQATTDFVIDAWRQTENRPERVSVHAMAAANRLGLRELLSP